MDGIKRDPFEEYTRLPSPDKRQLLFAWQTGIGLQAVDGLKTSDYLTETARDNIDGKISMPEANALIESYYKAEGERASGGEMEGDLVSARIAAIVSESGFTFSKAQYVMYHKRLFEGIYPHAGTLRTYNIAKKEWVLHGDTVSYGNAPELGMMLEYDIETERRYRFLSGAKDDVVKHLAFFVSRLWQIHAFAEGNTRTTAVFLIKYLRKLGFDVNNDAFYRNSQYFRNALVRANYSNVTKEIGETTEYLELFLKNLLYGEQNELRSRYLHIRWNEFVPKQHFDVPKQHFALPETLSSTTKRHVGALYQAFSDKAFGRSDITALLGITASPASELIRKMCALNLIQADKSVGRGKYRFVAPE